MILFVEFAQRPIWSVPCWCYRTAYHLLPYCHSRLSRVGAGRGMSALGQKQTCAAHKPMSALPPIANMCSALAVVRFVPKADIRNETERPPRGGLNVVQPSPSAAPLRGSGDIGPLFPKRARPRSPSRPHMPPRSGPTFLQWFVAVQWTQSRCVTNSRELLLLDHICTQTTQPPQPAEAGGEERESGLMSAFGDKADMCGALAHVCFVPKADMKALARTLAATPLPAALHGTANDVRR